MQILLILLCIIYSPPGHVGLRDRYSQWLEQIGEDKETGEVKRVKRKAQTSEMWDDPKNDRSCRPQNKVWLPTISRANKKKLPKKLVETANSKCWTYGKNNLQLNG